MSRTEAVPLKTENSFDLALLSCDKLRAMSGSRIADTYDVKHAARDQDVGDEATHKPYLHAEYR